MLFRSLAARGLSRPRYGTRYRIGFGGYRVRMANFDDNVRSLTGPVGSLGGAWMLHPEVLGPCREVGYPNGFAYYVTGRGGVLGDVDADVVSSAFGFFEPSLVRKLWEQGTAVESARASARRYGAACAEWGRSRYGTFAGIGRLAELAAAALPQIISKSLNGHLNSKPQVPGGASYWARPRDTDRTIDPQMGLEYNLRIARASMPYPGAFVDGQVADAIIKVWKGKVAASAPNVDRQSDRRLVLLCDGAMLLSVRPPLPSASLP